jgi:hypothetical protein
MMTLKEKTRENYRQFAGHCLPNNKALHVCGYESSHILIQEKAGAKMKKRRLYETGKGIYFNHKNKREYVVS